MATYIFFWNPDISNVTKEIYEERMFNTAAFTDWSISEYENVKDGDTFYMMICGPVNAIVAKGEIISEAIEGADWSKKKRKPIYYVELDTYIAINPFSADTLLTADDIAKEIPDFNWYGGHSGRLLAEDAAKRLDALFDHYVKSNRQLIRQGAMWDDSSIEDLLCDNNQNGGVPVIGISRHRIGTDGSGITALVAFHGCGLHCKYCINPQCMDSADKFPRYTPERLYTRLLSDGAYYSATGGGVTFGGGEPCLQADFIVRFREICDPEWKINIETSLNIDSNFIEKLVPVVDQWIVDIKTDDPAKYREYTGEDLSRVRNNLNYLVRERHVPAERILLRIPIIPGFVDAEQAEKTRQRFEAEGFARFDIFEYRTEKSDDTQDEDPYISKEKCKILREVREEIAAQSGCETLPPQHCTHIGSCSGTCPLCDKEMFMLSRQLRELNKRPAKVSAELSERIKSFRKLTDDGFDMGDIVVAPDDNFPDIIQPTPVYRKLFFKECPIAGLLFHVKKDDDLWSELDVGVKLALVRDRDNSHDRNAVAVALADDYDGDPDYFDFDLILGYIPRADNAEIAAMMDAGYGDKFLAEITTMKQDGPYNDRIRITVYIESREPVNLRPDLLRAEWLDDAGYAAMIDELKECGFAKFRWGGFPLKDRNLPEVGDKIVILHEEDEAITLHLMHVLMIGYDCLKPGINEEEFECEDDCVDFALTNVIGPIALSRDRLGFLTKPDLQRYSAMHYLSPKETDAFKQIFGITKAIKELY